MTLAIEAGGSVAVGIEELPPDAKANGAVEGALRTQVESALRRCGVSVVEGVDVSRSLFIVYLSAVSIKGGFVSNLRSEVTRVEKVKGRFVAVVVWSSSTLSVGPPGTMSGQVREVLAGQLDEFCNEYLKTKEAMNEARKK